MTPDQEQPVAGETRDCTYTGGTCTRWQTELLTQCNDNDSPWLICKTCAGTGKCAKAEPKQSEQGELSDEQIEQLLGQVGTDGIGPHSTQLQALAFARAIIAATRQQQGGA